MFQLMTQFGGYGIFAQIALALFFLAFMMILVTTLIRPKKQMEHYARLALSDDLPPADKPDNTNHADAQHGAEHHE